MDKTTSRRHRHPQSDHGCTGKVSRDAEWRQLYIQSARGCLLWKSVVSQTRQFCFPYALSLFLSAVKLLISALMERKSVYHIVSASLLLVFS